MTLVSLLQKSDALCHATNLANGRSFKNELLLRLDLHSLKKWLLEQ
jgi:hypothetical protein